MTTRQHAHAFLSSAGTGGDGTSWEPPGGPTAERDAADDDGTEEEGPASEDAAPLAAADEAAAAPFSADGGSWG